LLFLLGDTSDLHRNRVPGVPDPVPKFITRFQIRVIDTRFLLSLPDEKFNFGLLLHQFITYVMTFDFPLYLLQSLLFWLTYVFTFDITITDLDVEKNHRFVKNIR